MRLKATATRTAAVASAAIVALSSADISTAAPALADPTVPQTPALTQSIEETTNQLSPLDPLGRPKKEILDQARIVADQPGMDTGIRDLLHNSITFFEGSGQSDVNVPTNGGPIAQFIWPTVAGQCIGGTQAATGSAFAVPGPAPLPVPGVPSGHTAFVFTALGTGPVAQQQSTALNVQWVNLNTLRHGITPLAFTGINPGGPSTVSGVADTGSGTVVAILTGGVNTTEKDAHGEPTVAQCNFAPTTGIVNVQ